MDSPKDMLALERGRLEHIRHVRLIIEPPLAAEAARVSPHQDLFLSEEEKAEEMALENRKCHIDQIMLNLP